MIDQEGIIVLLDGLHDEPVQYANGKNYYPVALKDTPYLRGVGDCLFSELKVPESCYDLWVNLELVGENVKVGSNLIIECPFEGGGVKEYCLNAIEKRFILSQISRQCAEKGCDIISVVRDVLSCA